MYILQVLSIMESIKNTPEWNFSFRKMATAKQSQKTEKQNLRYSSIQTKSVQFIYKKKYHVKFIKIHKYL